MITDAPLLLVAQAIVGAIVGHLASRLHRVMIARALARGVAHGSPRSIVLALPLRVALPTGLLFALALWGPTAAIAGALAFGLTSTIAAARAREEARP